MALAPLVVVGPTVLMKIIGLSPTQAIFVASIVPVIMNFIAI